MSCGVGVNVGATVGATDGPVDAAASLADAAAVALGALLALVPVHAARNAAKPARAVPWTNARRDRPDDSDGCFSFM